MMQKYCVTDNVVKRFPCRCYVFCSYNHAKDKRHTFVTA